MTEAPPGAKDRFWRYHEDPFLPSPIPGHLVEMSHYQPKLHVVLHQPEIPYNTGSVGRTCVAVGAKLWLVRPLGFQVDDYHLRRAGMDYWQHLEWETVDDWEALEETLAPGRTWFFTKKAEQNYLDAEFQPGDALVFGSESQGLPGSILAKYADKTVRISTRPQVRSLNLSNSVAVATYEALRQWATP
ncbi:MAG: tRNA (cytidine(34)-2'-O)-methyltransferase [Pirellulales bacterium]|nr:tRNA (cytidine(34)-2'-O)-methyltransferase [Pirellulales bacterium]